MSERRNILIIGAIAKAIRDERERCAKIAENFDLPSPGDVSSHYFDGGSDAGQAIAAAIRRGFR